MKSQNCRKSAFSRQYLKFGFLQYKESLSDRPTDWGLGFGVGGWNVGLSSTDSVSMPIANCQTARFRVEG